MFRSRINLSRQTGSCGAGHASKYDDEQGCFDAVRYLSQLGHSHIWYIGDAARQWHSNRLRGYVRAAKELGLNQHVHTIALSDDEFENGQSAVSYILDQGWPRTAILAASHELAFGAREGLRQHRRDVPKDVSLIGFEHGVRQTRASNLTSVFIDMVEVGRQLARAAIREIEGADCETRDVVLPAVLVKRSTCRPLRKKNTCCSRTAESVGDSGHLGSAKALPKA